MAHRNDPNRGTPHTGTGAGEPRHYAGPEKPGLYNGMPSATNRSWGEDRASEAYTFGPKGLGGYGDFTQGGYGESQGRHAQSGHGRGGSRFGGREFQEREARGFRGRGPQGYVRSDERIRDDIIDRLTDDATLDASEILLMVEGGVATLTGNVPERAMKHRAEDIAAEASGVRDVRNELRVDNGAASFGRPGEAVRSGNDQPGSAFSSSARPDPVWDNVPEDSNWHPEPPTREG
jgi:hypothetical protein